METIVSAVAQLKGINDGLGRTVMVKQKHLLVRPLIVSREHADKVGSMGMIVLVAPGWSLRIVIMRLPGVEGRKSGML